VAHIDEEINIQIFETWREKQPEKCQHILDNNTNNTPYNINSTEFGVDWIYLAHHTDQWRAVLKTEIHFQLPTPLECWKFLD
jgi:hypothetical protein